MGPGGLGKLHDIYLRTLRCMGLRASEFTEEVMSWYIGAGLRCGADIVYIAIAGNPDNQAVRA